MIGCPSGRRNKREYRKRETQYDKKESGIPGAGVRAAADAGRLRGESAKRQPGAGSGAESTSASDSQAEQPKVAEVTGGSEREGAEEVPLDTKLKGKTVREETQWFSF